jgi:hypothetical protein
MKFVMKAGFIVLRMRCVHTLVILSVVSLPISKCEEEAGAEYLKSVISNLQSERVQPLILWNNINQAHTTDGIPGHHDKAGTIIGPTPLPFVSKKEKVKSKAISVTGRGGPKGCKMLRIPHCLDNWLTDGGKVVNPMHRPLLYSPETLFLCFWYPFLLEAE